MRILVDLQAAQNDSALQGIGRYTTGLAKGLIESRKHHEIFLLINGSFPEHAKKLRTIFEPLLSEDHILTWYSPVGLDKNDLLVQEKTGMLYADIVLGNRPDVLLYCGFFHTADQLNGAYGLPYLADKVKCAAVVYDFIAEQYSYQFLSASVTEAGHQRTLAFYNYTDVLLCMSDYTAKEARNFLPSHFICSIGPASDIVEYQENNKVFTGITNPFILYAGGVSERKNVGLMAEAFSQLPNSVRQTHQLVIVQGEARENWKQNVAKYLNSCGIADNEVVLLDYVAGEDLAALYANCRCFVFLSLNGGSGFTLLEAMSCGAPVLAANATSLPEVVELQEALFDPTDVSDLKGKLERVLTEDAFRFMLLQNAVNQSRKFSWKATGAKAIATLENLGSLSVLPDEPVPQASYKTLLTLCEKLAHPDFTVSQTAAFARAIVRNLHLEPVKLIVDISNLFNCGDGGTGIERVVRSVLDCLVTNPPDGFQVCPVFLKEGQYYIANSYIAKRYPQLTGYRDKKDSLLGFSGKDIFLGLDLILHCFAHKSVFDAMRDAGTRIFFFVYDLLPVTLPFYFPDKNIKEYFVKWLTFIANYDGIIADSKAVADEYRIWRTQNVLSQDKDSFLYAYVHLGSNVRDYPASADDLPKDAKFILSVFDKRPTVLMVSTIEPRKGYQQTLSAFERLWSDNVDVNLVIVGRRGWMMDDFFVRLENHPERGERLFWLNGISDTYLVRCYEKATGVLMASEGEGFGLSLIEGAAYRKPLLVRNLPVFREVAGEHVSYFEGKDASSLAAAVKTWLSHIQNGTVPDSGNIHAATWQECTDAILDVLGLEKRRKISISG